jgi:dihydropteroate synthase
MVASLEDILQSHRTGRFVVMGILNVTPDSFSDGGKFLSTGDAIVHAEAMAAQGADVIDVGAESTRPGSMSVSPSEQIERLREILPPVARLGPAVSIDTTSSQVAAFALDTGAAIINDVTAGRDDPGMLPLAARRGCPIVLMHMLGRPRTMQDHPRYKDVVGEVCEFLLRRMEAAEAAGVVRDRIIVDPGIGFGKALEHNLILLAGVARLARLGRPVLLGVSRKRFIGQLTGVEDSAQRLAGTVAACLAGWGSGATIFRVHDVSAVRDALSVASAITKAGKSANPGS